MRIGIDARPLAGMKAGIGQYTENLIRSMSALAPDDEFFLFSNRPIDYPERAGCRQITGPEINGNLWLQTILPELLRQYRCDIFHSPLFISPLVSGIPTVITVHDMVHRLFPETTHWKNRLPLRLLLPSSLHRAAKIIAVSKNTRQDILKYHRTDPEKISVIYLGCDEGFKPQNRQAIEKVIGDLGLPERYILTVGTLEPRKNLVGLFQAFHSLLGVFPELEEKLVVVGAKGWRFSGIFSTLQDLGLEDRVIFTDYVSAERLPSIYAGARLFVYPSFYEGFGLPPLEAMACGVPVVSSAAGSLPEVVGQAAALFDPGDPAALCRAMERTLFDDAERGSMIQAGLAQAKKFSWHQAARETLAVYGEVLGRHSGGEVIR